MCERANSITENHYDELLEQEVWKVEKGENGYITLHFIKGNYAHLGLIRAAVRKYGSSASPDATIVRIKTGFILGQLKTLSWFHSKRGEEKR